MYKKYYCVKEDEFNGKKTKHKIPNEARTK